MLVFAQKHGVRLMVFCSGHPIEPVRNKKDVNMMNVTSSTGIDLDVVVIDSLFDSFIYTPHRATLEPQVPELI